MPEDLSIFEEKKRLKGRLGFRIVAFVLGGLSALPVLMARSDWRFRACPDAWQCSDAPGIMKTGGVLAVTFVIAGGVFVFGRGRHA